MRKSVKMVAMAMAMATTLAFASSGSANAATILFQDGSNYTSGTFGRSNVAAGNFTDVLNFSVGWWHDIAASLTSNATKIGKKGDIDFSKVVLTWNGSTPISYDFDIIKNGGSKGLTDTADLTHILKPGNYTLSITGYSYGGGSYGGQTFAEAVPEPASWAMMFGGFALIGCMIRRPNRILWGKTARA